jgi:hypothetical protein
MTYFSHIAADYIFIEPLAGHFQADIDTPYFIDMICH